MAVLLEFVSPESDLLVSLTPESFGYLQPSRFGFDVEIMSRHSGIGFVCIPDRMLRSL